MIQVQVFGIRCDKCDRLFANARQAAREAGVPCEVNKVSDIFRILDLAPPGLPALLINGALQSAGRVLGPGAIRDMIRAAAGRERRAACSSENS